MSDGARTDHGTRPAELVTLARRCPRTGWGLAQAPADAPDSALAVRLAAVTVGTALAALDEYEAFVRSRVTETAPAGPGDYETDERRWMGMAIGRLESAQCILDEAAAGGEDPSMSWILAREATRLAHDTASNLIVHVAGAAPRTERLTGALDVLQLAWSHPLGAQDDQLSRRVARRRLGLAEAAPTG